MGKFLHHSGAWILLIGFVSTTAAWAEDRPASQILADIQAVEVPKIPQDRNDRAAVQQYLVKRQKATEQRSVLIGELLKAHPEAPGLAPLMIERWQAAMIPGPKADEMNKEMDDVLAQNKYEGLVAEAAFVKAVIAVRKIGQAASAEEIAPIAEEFVKRAPKDPRGAMFLAALLGKTSDKAKKETLEARIAKDYAETPVAVGLAKEKRIREAIGKPFEIEFNDAIKGGVVSSATLKGKVVIVDFWATWCGPCIQEMPHMKELYAKFKDKGVEFVGVSLDFSREQGGYDKLKAFVEKNKIEWPQLYGGKGWESDFAVKWGIQSIPAVFAVDADGNLATTEAGGQLEELIPELLAKAEKKAKKTEAKP